MTTAKVVRTISTVLEYELNLDSPLWDTGMTDDEKLKAWVEMAEVSPSEAFCRLTPSVVVSGVEHIHGELL